MPTKLLILGVTLNTVVGQLFLKRGISALGGRAAFENFPRFLIGAAKSPWIYSSLAISAFGYFLWMIVISRVKLGVATASASAGFYLITALAAWAIYGESLNYLQWLGIILITIGVTCVSLGPV